MLSSKRRNNHSMRTWDRCAARCVSSVLMVTRIAGPGARSAPRDAGSKPRALSQFQRRSPRLAAISVFAAGLLVALPFAIQTANAGQTPEEVKADAVVAEARKALGGADKLSAIKRLQVNGTTRRANGNFNLEGDTELFLELPDKFRRNESLTLGGGGGTGIDRTEILNGNEFSSEVSGDAFGGRGRGRFGGGGGGAAGGADGRGAPTPEQQERLREFQRRNLQSEVSRLLIALLLTSETPFRWIGTAQAPEGSADVLEVKTPDGVATRVFIDTMTHMPLMLTWTGPAGRGFGGRGGQGRRGQGAPDQAGGPPPEGRAAGDQPPAAGAGADQAQGRRGRGAQGPPATLQMHLSEYKTVNGIKLPHLITRGASGETNAEWAIKSYKINPNLKANTFTK